MVNDRMMYGGLEVEARKYEWKDLLLLLFSLQLFQFFEFLSSMIAELRILVWCTQCMSYDGCGTTIGSMGHDVGYTDVIEYS